MRPPALTEPTFRAATALCLLALSSCRTADPNRFDSTLRAATFDAYVEQLGLQRGAFARDPVDPAHLTDSFRSRAVEADGPVAFYRVLTELLISLDDPHTELIPAEQHWPAVTIDGEPTRLVAQPDRCELARVDDDIWVGYPDPPTELPPEHAMLERLIASASPDGPQRWSRLLEIDNVPVHSRNDAQLLLRGRVGTFARLLVATQPGRTEIVKLCRNTQRDQLHGDVVRLIEPRDLQPTPIIATLRGNHHEWFADRVGRPVASMRRPPFPSAELWRIGDIAYLRIGSFALWSNTAPHEVKSQLDQVIEAAGNPTHWVIDLLGNHGGLRAPMAHLASHFLPASHHRVPHLVREVTVEDGWFQSLLHAEHKGIERADVPPCQAESTVVLVDQWTFSAGEILAAILRDGCQAILIGDRTGGAEFAVKAIEGIDGSVLELGDGGGMVDGFEQFQGIGLEPDVGLPLSTDRLTGRRLAEIQSQQRFEIRSEALRRVGLDPEKLLRPPE